MLIFGLLAALLASFACASYVSPLPAVAHEPLSTPPPWYLAPPRDTASALYGVGSAPRLPAAKSAALVDVAAKLVISVRARQVDRSVLHNDQLEQHFESELEARVRHREFRDYEVVESALSAGTFYALVRIDRNRLVADTLRGLIELDREIAFRLERVSEGTPVAYELAYGSALPSLGRAAASVELLRALDPQFDGSPFLSRFRTYRARYESSRDQVVFALLPGVGSTGVAEMVQELFAKEGLQSEVVPSDAEDGGACRSVCVEVEAEWSRRFAARRYLTTLTSTFRVRDASGNVTAARSHKVRGSALTGYAQASAAATEKLRQELLREGVLAAIGLGSSDEDPGLRL